MHRTFASARAIGQVVFLSWAVACERPRVAAARPDTAAPDTIVRQVVRVTRPPSAMQRVTGRITALRALEPLDSVLAVRVLDQRGRELRDVPVVWSLTTTGNGATLRIVNARTDALGVSRAQFTPGSSADEQVVLADVATVGRIAFGVTVPVRTIRLIPEQQAIWSGDSALISAELRDVSGTELTGGTIVWATTDSTVVRAEAHGKDGLVRARLAGTASVVGWIEPGTVRASARVRVKPVLNGRFITLDGSAPAPMSAELLAGTVRESLSVREGRFSARADVPPGQDAVLIAAPEHGAGVHSLRVSVAEQRALQALSIALVPSRWRITGGSYDGQEIAIDAQHALRRAEGSTAFWRLVPLTGQNPKKLLSWTSDRLPLRIAFNRKRSVERVSADDSVHFWRIAAQMERDLGGRFFTPAEIRGDSVGADVIPVEIGGSHGAGHTFVSWSSAGDAFDAVVSFRSAATLRDAHVVTHELLHLLGFGHTVAWPSVLRPSAGTEQRLTVTDVAYAQLALRLRQVQQQHNARPGLPP